MQQRDTSGSLELDQTSARLIRALAVTTFLLWLGASSILPLLPQYLRHRGSSLPVVGAVMGAYFAGAFLFQYPAGRLTDRIGRRPVLVGGLVCYALASLGFLLPLHPVADIGLRALQGVGTGAAEIAALSMVSSSVVIERRGRAFGAIYGAQLGGMAIGPLTGSLIGLGRMHVIFIAAGVGAGLACIPALAGSSLDERPSLIEQTRTKGPPRSNRLLIGSLLAAAAFGLTIGVYESSWTLLLTLRHAHDWQIGLSWTMFAAPFAAMSRPGGWLADHFDRRWLVFGGLISTSVFCVIYPYLHSLVWLIILGGVEAIGVAIALPSAQSLLSQAAPPNELGRVQGLFSTTETAAIAVSASAGGALFGYAAWAPFVFGATASALLAACLPMVWRSVMGKVPPTKHEAIPRGPGVLQS